MWKRSGVWRSQEHGLRVCGHVEWWRCRIYMSFIRVPASSTDAKVPWRSWEKCKMCPGAGVMTAPLTHRGQITKCCFLCAYHTHSVTHTRTPHTHTHMCTHSHACTHRTHSQAHNTHTCTQHTHAHTLMHTTHVTQTHHLHSHAHMHMHTHAHARTHSHHTYTHILTCTHTHTHFPTLGQP